MGLSDRFARLARQVSLFEGLSPEDIARIFSKGRSVKVSKGQTLFHKGTTGSEMFVVLGGAIGLYDGQKPLARLTTGDTFGEMALISSEPRSATAVAEEDASLFILTESTFQHLMTKRVAIRMLLNIIRTMSERLRETNRKLAAAQE